MPPEGRLSIPEVFQYSRMRLIELAGFHLSQLRSINRSMTLLTHVPTVEASSAPLVWCCWWCSWKNLGSTTLEPLTPFTPPRLVPPPTPSDCLFRQASNLQPRITFSVLFFSYCWLLYLFVNLLYKSSRFIAGHHGGNNESGSIPREGEPEVRRYPNPGSGAWSSKGQASVVWYACQLSNLCCYIVNVSNR